MKYKGLLIFFASFLISAKNIAPDEKVQIIRNVSSSQVSNLNIKAFCQDSLGYMWIATPRGLNRYNGYEFIHYFHDKYDTLTIDNDFILSLFLDSSHRLWIGTSTGIDRYDFTDNHFYHYESPVPLYTHSFLEDSNGKIWAATSYGAVWVDTVSRTVQAHPRLSRQPVMVLWEDPLKRLWAGSHVLSQISDDVIRDSVPLPDHKIITCMTSDPQGGCWMGTNSGILILDPTTQKLRQTPEILRQNKLLNSSHIHFIKEVSPLKFLIGTSSQGLFLYDIVDQKLIHNPPEYTGNLNSEQLISCYVDIQDNVWLGSFDKGFSVFNIQQQFFNSDKKLSDTFKDTFVTRVIEDAYGNFWIGTRYNGLFRYSRNGEVMHYHTSNYPELFKNEKLIEALFIDSGNRLWIGLNEALVCVNIGPAGKLAIAGQFPVPTVGSASFRQDYHGNIWVATSSGLYLMKNNKNSDIKPERICSENVPDVYIRSNGDILFSIYGTGIFQLDTNTYQFEKIVFPDKDAEAVAKHCVNIFEDSQERIWLGSYGEGALGYSPENYKVFTRANGLSSNDITCIREDSHGDIWMSSSNGLIRLKRDFNIINYFSYDGTLGDQYHEKAGLVSSDGRIFFTGNHGLTFFDPLVELPAKSPPMVRFEDLKVLNQSIEPQDNHSILKKSISFTDHIVLNHKHPVFSIDYTGIDFPSPQNITYAYKLDGFDTQWNDVGNYRRATYSNLMPGDYTFIVKAFTANGLESKHPATLHVTIKPAPWFTWHAWALYFLLFLTGIIFLFRLVFKIKLHKQNLDIEHNEREREREIAEMKLVFFTNISHELRTPLTLISAPLQQLLANHPEETTDKRLLMTISRNVQRLLRLMNQLLDFRKMENGMLALKVQLTDVISLINNVMESYTFPASERNLTISSDVHTPYLELWVDTDKLEKILHNLLSNALKYTPAKGQIKISTTLLENKQAQNKYDALLPEDTYLEISVQDTGIGVPSDKLDEIFERYRQIDPGKGNRPDYAGTGIGLHYTRRLVETHKGRIKAFIPEEGGTVFSFILPLKDVYTENEKDVKKDTSKDPVVEIPPQVPSSSTEPQKHKYTILVAEDNIELMAFLRDMLSSKYNLIEAVDGNEAWDIVQKKSPDLILSDVLMPVMSGYELCANVKTHPLLSHIPVVLLTAKSTMDDQIEGLEQGADAYICKPFNVEYLMLTIKNQLTNRDVLRQYYSTPQGFGTVENPVKLNKMDQKFMDKLLELLDKELSNSELNIDDIAKEMAFSRTSFYRKLKGLTDMSPADFLRNYRLKRAAEMINEDCSSLLEVAENTGFGTYTYFSVAFKKHFGVSPKDYKIAAK